MAEVFFKGINVHSKGELPLNGTEIPDFKLVKTDLSLFTKEDIKGKKVIFNIFPSLDTSTCATSVRQFNVKAANKPNTIVVGISKDLPFAHKRFCTAEGIENVISVSDFRNSEFGDKFGVTFIDGPLEGLHSRAVIVVDENSIVTYSQQVLENTLEPDYEAALNALNN